MLPGEFQRCLTDAGDRTAIIGGILTGSNAEGVNAAGGANIGSGGRAYGRVAHTRDQIGQRMIADGGVITPRNVVFQGESAKRHLVSAEAIKAIGAIAARGMVRYRIERVVPDGEIVLVGAYAKVCGAARGVDKDAIGVLN